MEITKWVDQFETPVVDLSNDEIRKELTFFANSQKFSKFTKVGLNPKLTWLIVSSFVLITYIMVGLVYRQRNITPYSVRYEKWSWDEWLIYGGVSIAIICIVAPIWRKLAKMNAISVYTSRFNYTSFLDEMTKSIPNFQITGIHKNAIVNVFGLPIKSNDIPQNATYDVSGSFVVGIDYDNAHYKLATTLFKPGGLVSSIAISGPQIEGKKISVRYRAEIILEADHVLQDLSNTDFNKHYNVYGNPIEVRKIFNATEQEKYVYFANHFKDIQWDCDNGYFVITFTPPFLFMVPSITLKKNKLDIESIIAKANIDIITILNHFSLFTSLRAFK